MSKTYILEISLEMGLINRVMFNDLEIANKELDKLKEKMGTRYGKNSEEVIEIISDTERCCVVVGRIQSAAVIDRFEFEHMQQDTAKAIAAMHNESWMEETKKIIAAGLGDYIKK